MFPFNGSKTDAGTLSKRVLTDGQDEPVTRIKRTARQSFDLNFTQRHQSELDTARDYWDLHYPEKRFVFRDLRKIPPVDDVFRLPIPSEFSEKGGDTIFDFSYSFPVIESVSPIMTTVPPTPVPPISETPDPVELYPFPTGALRVIDVGRTSGGTIDGREQDIFTGGTVAVYTAAVDQTGEANLIPPDNARSIRIITTDPATKTPSASATFSGLTPNGWYRLRFFSYVDGGTFQTVVAVNDERQLHYKYPKQFATHVDNSDIVAKANSSGELNVAVIGEGAGTYSDTGVFSEVHLFPTSYTTDAFAKHHLEIGDSIVAGAPDYLTANPYPNRLGVLLNANVKQINGTYARTYDPTREWLITNAAVSGQKASDALTNYASQVTANYKTGKANSATILIGSNDIAAGDSAATILTRLTTLVSQAKSDGFNPVRIGTILPRTDFNSSKETVRTTLNSSILAGSTGADSVLNFAADSHLSNAADTTNYPDGIHPSGAYQYLADMDYALISSGIPSAQNVTFGTDFITYNGDQIIYG